MHEWYSKQDIQTCGCHATVPLTFLYIVAQFNFVVDIVDFMTERLLDSEINIVIAFTIDEANRRFGFGKLHDNKAHVLSVICVFLHYVLLF